MKMVHYKPLQTMIDAPRISIKTQSSPPGSDLLVPLSSLTAVTTYVSPAKISIPVQITFRTSYVWQIFFRQTFEIRYMDLAINQHDVSQKV